VPESRPCIFCEIVAGRVAEEVLFEDADHIAFFPLEHINPGHLLLIPKRHTEYLFDMDAAAYHALWAVAARLALGLRSLMSAVRIGVVIDGFTVPHVHIHLVPTYARDELNPARAKPLDAAEAERLRNLLRHELSGRGDR
jgi:histidine triad (HIT) family protein